MPGLFQGIELGKRALLSHQLYLQTVGHNIANVNTPGYSRQRVNLTTTYPEHDATGSIGTGVTVSDIRHVRDLLLGAQFRRENKSLGQWSDKQRIMTQIEAVFAEPNDNTLSDLLNDFWNAWSDLSTDPRSNACRRAVIDSTSRLTARFHDMAGQLGSLSDALNREIVSLVADVNRLTSEIAALNGQIALLELGGQRANDLRDRQDYLIDDLSRIVDVNTVTQPNGQVLVMIGALAVVDGAKHTEVGTVSFNDRGFLKHRLVLQDSDITVRNTNGRLKGLLDARDDIIPGYLAELDDLARGLVQQVNAVHETGFGLDGSAGRPFFDETFSGAASIRLNPLLVDNLDRIAASATGQVGDNAIALEIQGLRDRLLAGGGTATLNDYYNSVVGKLGMEAREAQELAGNYELLVHQILNARESVQGVSLDEEMANMVRLQHAYDAAARVITTMDEALDTVILRMGVTGR